MRHDSRIRKKLSERRFDKEQLRKRGEGCERRGRS